MRKSREEAAQTRKRIVTAASGEFRKNGVVATGINDLMRAAGLTHGGFYKHFKSKDHVVAEACAEAVEAMIERLTAAGSSAVAMYLSTRHRDDPAARHGDDPAVGCPLAAIGSELGRGDEKTRAVATEGVLKLDDVAARQFRKDKPGDARRRALVAVSTMVGAMTISRMVTDPELSAEILRSAEEHLTLQ